MKFPYSELGWSSIRAKALVELPTYPRGRAWAIVSNNGDLHSLL